MALSERAVRYLARLPRHPPVSGERVSAAIERAGYPAHPAWLDFHARYAGYEESLGQEVAIWGIVHDQTLYLAPGEALVDKDDDGRDYVVCAEVHGAFGYHLYEDGVFESWGAGGPCETFDTKVEQNAAFRETTQDGRQWGRDYEFTKVPARGLGELRAASGAGFVAEASDKFMAVWRGRDVFWLEGRSNNHLNLWTTKDARERVRAWLR